MSRPYPRRCGTCGEKTVNPIVLESHSCEVKHDGKLYAVVAKEVPASRCDNCAALLFGQGAEEAVDRALRDYLALLQPELIKKNIHGLSKQNVVAEHIGAAPETVSRWIGGSSIQSRMSDKFLRAYFAVPALREFLGRLLVDPSLGEEVVLSKRPQQFQGAKVGCADAHIDDNSTSIAANSNYALAA